MDMLFGDELLERPHRAIAPDAVHLPGWLNLEQQRWIADRFREWATGPVPARAASIGGHPMSVRTVCLGWHWQPYRYTRDATDVNGQRVLDFPDWLLRLGRRAVADAYHDADAPVPGTDPYTPDAALANYYDAAARMGMHQDKDEASLAPVVSLSIGDSCRFRFGNTENRSKPYQDVQLRSGDLFVFGGASRLAYHGVPKVFGGTAPAGCGLAAGRINLTLRATGLEG
jgi:alkylated DNA repair protein (DNA oxidative demethylase)